MTELSTQYACSPATGDYGPLTVENLAMARLLFGGFSLTDGGVIYWLDPNYVFQVTTTGNPSGLSNAVDGLLEPTEAASVVTIDTGTAIVNGYLYFNDTTVAFDVNSSPGNANATDIIALRWTAASQSVRLTRIAGAASSTAVLTQTTTIWDIPIAEVALDGSGLFSTLTDVRKYAQTTLFPPTRTVTGFVPLRNGTLTDASGFTENEIAAAGLLYGTIFPDAAVNGLGISYIVPSDFVDSFTFYAVGTSGSTGNVRYVLNGYGGMCAESPFTHSTNDIDTLSVTANQVACTNSLAFTGLTRGDLIQLSFYRFGTDGADTLAADFLLWGFVYEYQGYDGVFVN